MKPALIIVVLISTFFTATLALSHASDLPTITQDEPVRRTQELVDAVAPGNKAPWEKYFADDCIFSDEKGNTMDKAKLIAGTTPLPEGHSGTIKVVNPQSRIFSDVAILSYDLNETEIIFGQRETARYHVTDTWLRRSGEWKIIATQAHRYYEDPAVGRVDEKKFADYIGTYELASGQVREVTAENGKLFVERKGKQEELLPEASDIFFRKNIEGRILFHYDANGKVDTLIDRRNNEDVVWKKVK